MPSSFHRKRKTKDIKEQGQGHQLRHINLAIK
jgi:hypothetical protein